MKPSVKQILISLLLLLSISMRSYAEDKDSYYIVSGIVKDKFSRKSLDYANVSLSGSNVGTVTNEDGAFSLKIDKTIKSGEVELSHVGYRNIRITISGTDILDEIYYLAPELGALNAAIAQSWEDPRKLIETALRKVDQNYSKRPNLITGFYRETAQKRRAYINLSEAIINIYKTSYSTDGNTHGDRVQILKGRQLLSQKNGDTLIVKLLGGPNMAIFADVVKNPDMLFSLKTLSDYNFKMMNPVMIDDRLQFTVNFEPQSVMPYPLFYGTAYIDQKTLTFTRIEFSMDMSDKNKATDVILRRKPGGLRFKPEELTFTVTYKQRDDKTYLNYMRNDIKFKCDWKRRLFATNYTVTSELVATEIEEHISSNISRKEAFKPNESLSDKVMSFYDSNFWGAYNIIEPSESLESAVNKLKKQYK
ncbi:MAG: carboxypeptidase-like regulatory domain-containing protein [Prevotellaceae bacterium]|jgi:hypothetical protein|nr:carboxypeptidase-like regulatory domain-containing protein [Prevotellaceae bacterium]